MSGAEDIRWNLQGRLIHLRTPIVMGVLNPTPDSFFAGSRAQTADAAIASAGMMLEEGAAIIDIGGASSRWGRRSNVRACYAGSRPSRGAFRRR